MNLNDAFFSLHYDKLRLVLFIYGLKTAYYEFLRVADDLFGVVVTVINKRLLRVTIMPALDLNQTD